MREKEVFYKYLQTKGLKRTTQREDILDLFLATESHQSADDMYHVLKEKDSGIGFSTIYRTLKLFKECGLAREVNFADGRAYFEHDFEHPHHDHLVCLDCGNTIEFFNETIESLQDKVAEESEFTPVRHSMVIFGYCRECQQKRSKA